jgi:hypothetical protein
MAWSQMEALYIKASILFAKHESTLPLTSQKATSAFSGATTPKTTE